MGIQAVFFDVGGTIETYSFTPEYRVANTHLFRDCLERGGISLEISDETLEEVISRGCRNYHLWNLNSMIELSTVEIWSEYVFKDFHVDRDGLAEISEELSFLYETKFYNRVMRPEIPEVLQDLKLMGYKIGCISNTQSITQVPWTLKTYGLADYFDPVVLSSQYGRRKPDPAIFYQAAQRVCLPTGSCAYVGDKNNRDILGARRAGFGLAVYIRHQFDDGEKDEGATPDYMISDMRDLTPILENEKKKNNHKKTSHQNEVVKAIFFDAGDILYYRPERNPNFQKFLEGKELNPPADLEYQRTVLKDLAYQGKIRRHEYFEQLTRLYGIKDSKEIAEGVAALRLDEDVFEIIEGVPQTIKKLKERGYILAIITDTAMPFSKKLSWFDQYGFGRVWDAVISSKEIGVRKPSAEMYEKAISQTGVRVNEAVFVGHKKSELDGAKAVGLKTIAFNYDKDAVADFYIDHFSDLLLLKILER